jgi:hypothetical protein
MRIFVSLENDAWHYTFWQEKNIIKQAGEIPPHLVILLTYLQEAFECQQKVGS